MTERQQPPGGGHAPDLAPARPPQRPSSGTPVQPGEALRYVQIQTQSRCNADCVFCPYSESWHAAHPGRMSDALWARILEDLVPFRAGLSRGMIAPYLMQEPLLDPTIFRKIGEIYQLFPRTMVQLSTNSGALAPRLTDRLLTALDGHKHQIWVSHHGIDPSSLWAIMRIDHDRALRNLVYLLQRAAGRFRILIRGAGHHRDGRPGWFEPEAYRAYWDRIFHTHQIDTHKVHVDAFTFHARAGSLQRRDRGAHLLSVGPVREIGPEHPFSCPRLDRWLHILYDGRIRLCCMDYHGAVKLPSLEDMSISEYYASEVYQDLRAQLTGARATPPDFICKRCLSPGG